MSERPLMLNHVEMVYRPGEREHARAFFETLGFGVTDFGPWLMIKVDPETGNGIDNVMYANEPIPAQRNFEDVLERAISADPELGAVLDRYRTVRLAHPQYNFHFGASMPSYEEWQARRARVEEAAATHPLLAGRMQVAVFEPGHPDSVTPGSQCFVLTDVLAVGPLSLGMVFELQWRPPNAEGVIRPQAAIKLPDFASMV